MNEIEELINELNELNKKIRTGPIENPAKIVGDTIVVNRATQEEKEEIIDLIGTWSYEKETTRIKLLFSKRDKKLKELKKLLNK